MKPILVIADFDDTLIKSDSLATIMKKERWFLKPQIALLGLSLLFKKGTPTEMQARSRMKLALLKAYANLSNKKKAIYNETFRQQLNEDVLKMIENDHPAVVLVISASEEDIILNVLNNRLKTDGILANHYLDAIDHPESFQTCYGTEKVNRLKQYFPDYGKYQIIVYTDSYSDQPLMDLADTTHMIKDGRILT